MSKRSELSLIWVRLRSSLLPKSVDTDLLSTHVEAADVILTVPAAWDAAGCSIMREAAIKAGMVQSARGGDRNWRDRLRIIT